MKQKLVRYETRIICVLLGAVLLGIAAIMLVASDGEMQAAAASLSTTDTEITAVTSVPPSRGFKIGAAKETTTTTTTVLYYKNTPISEFRVDDLTPLVDTDMDYTKWWYSEKDDCRYLFLPATADTEKLKITYTCANSLYLNDTKIVSGEVTDLFSKETEFSIRIADKNYGKLYVMQSDLPVVYMELDSGSLAQVEKKNGNKDKGKILMLKADSTVEYNGALDSIGGHGNSSWDYSTKKPYNIKLPEKTKLYGMGKAKKWALLSNNLDHGMIRNSVAMMLSKGAGCDFTMQYEYVDLYAHGEYRGTYQLFERVQVQKHRVDITDLEEANEAANDAALDSYAKISSNEDIKTILPDTYKYWDIPKNPEDITGGYLFQFQTFNRYPGKAESGFVTKRGQCVQLETPEHATKAEIDYIRDFVQDLEDAIYSETGYNAKGKHYSDYLDVDSIILSYLIQEITSNADGSYTSFYFWKESDLTGDGKLHCGPVWDFDLSMANFGRAVFGHACSNANNFFAMYLPIHGYEKYEDTIPEMKTGWLGTLYAKPEYQERVVELYFERFDSLIDNIAEEKIPALEKYLTKSADMNNARWDMLGKNRKLGPVNGYTYHECVEYVTNYLTKHQKFIQSQWLGQAQHKLSDSLAAEMNKLPLFRYSEDGLEQLKKKVAQGQAAVLGAESYAESESAYKAALNSYDSVPFEERCGDFDDNGLVDCDDATAVLIHYTKILAELEDPLTERETRCGDVNGDGVLNADDAMHILNHYLYELTGDSYPLPTKRKLTQ